MEERWQIPVVSVGDVLRKEIATGSAIGREAASFMDLGRLVPDRVAVAAVEAWTEGDTASSFVFDGFPRSVGQAQALEEMLMRHHTPLTAALWLELDNEAIAHRVSRRVTCGDCGRSFQIGWHVGGHTDACPVCGGRLTVRTDDDPATLTSRMEQYRAHTEPVRDFYAARGLLRVIDAGRSPDEVFGEIEKVTSIPEEAAAA